ncbi:hypothetical protein PLESTB_001476300 [Pleodorina starrii]|uniref:HPP transmembrane region domain-containing protein n=1 Tax=Pleodorina starrii TaxID=330485 RepID=A0A9W6BWF7_9CHLO|nr:hypothetical protein PLESTB_001476300 [Pleodorina starrii]
MTVRNGGGDGQQLPATSSSVTVTTEAALANTTPASFLSEYLQKWRGANEAPLPRESLRTLVISWSGAFIAILVLAVLDQYAGPPLDFNFLIAPLGASAVLMFGVPAVKLSQPRNVIGGHSLSALVGILVRLVLQPQYGGGRANFVASALGMSLGLTAMQATGTTHPPGGWVTPTKPQPPRCGWRAGQGRWGWGPGMRMAPTVKK